jgi:RNA polymerase subunit RPABC4/transcription elongation factor Spt4
MDTEQLTSILTGGAIYGGVIVFAFWIGMIVWTFRDMRARSRDVLGQILATLAVAALTIPGLVLYLFLRPKETLAEAYERSLEEEALLQEIENKPLCPGCKQRVQDDWQACPNCHTRLKKPCIRCSKMLDLTWEICPYCLTPQAVYQPERPAAGHTRPSSPHAEPMTASAPAAYESRSRARRRSESVEFVDGESG